MTHADPATKAEFAGSGKLTLRLHRIETVDLSDLLYSLPSICDRLPGTEGTPRSTDDLVLAEDDWRQFELVSGAFSEQTCTFRDFLMACPRKCRENEGCFPIMPISGGVGGRGKSRRPLKSPGNSPFAD